MSVTVQLTAEQAQGLTPTEAGRALAALTPPITDEQAWEAARILASAA